MRRLFHITAVATGQIVAVIALAVLFAHCDASKPSNSNPSTNKQNTPLVRIEEHPDHVQLFEYRVGPNGEQINHGKYLVKSLDGKTLAEGFFADGKETGIWRAYFPDGKLRFEGEYLFGDKNGEWVYYDATGAVEKKELFVNGKLAVPIDSLDSDSKSAAPAASQPIVAPQMTAPAATQPTP